MGKNKCKYKNNFSYQPVQILHRFKSLFASGNWIEALNCYRSWLNRTGNKVNNRIEGELLLRSAGTFYKKNELEQAIRLLDEAASKDPQNADRYHRLKAVCYAKQGKFSKCLEIFIILNDDFHKKLISYLIENNISLPRTDYINSIEKSIILNLWDQFVNVSNSISTDTAVKLNSIKNILKAYAGSPENHTTPFGDAVIFSLLADEFSLILDVHKRNDTEIRKTIEKDPNLYKGCFYSELLLIHLSSLLQDKKYNDIVQLCNIFKEKGIHLSYIAEFCDESLFYLGLYEVKRENYEKGLTFFLQITKDNPIIIHNTALCYQKLERYYKANEYWKKLLRFEKRPKRIDPENAIAAYTAILKYIGHNYLQEENPEEAYKYFKDVLDYFKDDKETLESLVSICIDSQRFGEIFQYSKKLYDLDPENIEYTILYLGELRHSGNYEEMIPIYQKFIALNPDNKFFKMGLAECYIEKAWKCRKINHAEAKALLEETGKINVQSSKKLYLEGFFLQVDGRTKDAQKRFNTAMEYKQSHMEQFDLGLAFYEDDMISESIKMFKSIASCGCESSYEYFKDAIKYLGGRNDYKSVKKLCDFVHKNSFFHLRDISGILYDNKKYTWAKEYSSSLIKESDADDEDQYLHLLILNSCGHREETLDYAQSLYDAALQYNNAEDIFIFKEILKQVNKKGQFRLT